MTMLFSLIAHVLVTIARLAQDRLGAVVAEFADGQPQLLILRGTRRRAPQLISWVRLALGGLHASGLI